MFRLQIRQMKPGGLLARQRTLNFVVCGFSPLLPREEPAIDNWHFGSESRVAFQANRVN